MPLITVGILMTLISTDHWRQILYPTAYQSACNEAVILRESFGVKKWKHPEAYKLAQIPMLKQANGRSYTSSYGATVQHHWVLAKFITSTICRYSWTL